MRALVGVILTLPLVAGAMSEQERVGVLNSALAVFDRGNALRTGDPAAATNAYREAAAGFQSLIDDGVRNGKLYYNLGNAQLQIGDLGHAIANYRRSERLIPNDSNLRENLRFARSLCRNQIPTATGRAALKTLFFWHYQTPLRTRYWVGLSAYLLFWMTLMLRLYWRRVRWMYLIVPLFAVWASLGGSVVTESVVRATTNEGVIVAEDVVVRKGDGETYEPQFKEALHPGVELEVLEIRHDWMRIRLTDGNEGWVPTRSVEII